MTKDYKKVILIDRFTDSTLAYQHYGMGINKKIIEHINKYLLKEIKINFTFLNIVNEKNSKKRLLKRKRLNRNGIQEGLPSVQNGRHNPLCI